MDKERVTFTGMSLKKDSGVGGSVFEIKSFGRKVACVSGDILCSLLIWRVKWEYIYISAMETTFADYHYVWYAAITRVR